MMCSRNENAKTMLIIIVAMWTMTLIFSWSDDLLIKQLACSIGGFAMVSSIITVVSICFEGF